MKAYVGKDQIVLRFPPAENLSRSDWESILHELKSHPIPSLYQTGKRSHASFEPGGVTRVVIYLTERTVTPEEAQTVLQRWHIDLIDENGDPL